MFLCLNAAKPTWPSTSENDLINQGCGLNEIRGFNITNHQSGYTVKFDRLRTENNKLGFFRSGAHKILLIEGLEICQTYHAEPVTQNKAASSQKLEDVQESQTSVKSILKKIRLNVDISNVSELFVRGFKFENKYEDETLLVKSSKAITKLGNRNLVLGGRIEIETPEVGIVQCGRAEWDVENKCIQVVGRYVAEKNGEKFTGTNLVIGLDTSIIFLAIDDK